MKKAIITGGAGMIGSAVCTALKKDGWEVAAFDTQNARAATRSIECDISDPISVTEAFETLGWDRIDLLVNNAAAFPDFESTLQDFPLNEWNRIITTNLTGSFVMSQQAAKRMNKDGSIINLASTRARMSEGGDFAYSASKGGIISLTRSLAIALGPDIRVNAIAPGWITDEKNLRNKDHDQHPVGRAGRPDDIAEAIIYLASAGFVTGEVLTIDGGMTRKMIYVE